MFEKWIRAAFPKLQVIYDKMPYVIQNLLTSIRGYVLTRMRYQPLFWEFLDGLLEREKLSPDKLIQYQSEQLNALIKYCYENTHFYRKQFSKLGLKISDIQETSDLLKIPLLTRESVRANWQDLISTSTNKTIKVYTSGTSGSGIPCIYDEIVIVQNWAYQARQRIWANVYPRDWRITMFGNKVVPVARRKPPFWTYNYPEKQILLSIFHISEANKDYYINFLQNHTGMVIEGFPTVLNIIADFIIQENKSIPMKAVFTTAEPLYPFIRDKIERAFSTKVYDSYGMTELVGLIQECKEGKYHLISDYGILEVLDEDGQPLSQNEEGYLVWTGLINLAMPLIRYQIGDKGMWEIEQTCPCGKPFPLVHPTITRDSDYLMTIDGRILSPRAVNQVLKNKMSFQVCQFVQKNQDTVVLRVVPGKGNLQHDVNEVQRALQELLGNGMNILFEKATEPIRRGQQGKIPLIISDLGRIG